MKNKVLNCFPSDKNGTDWELPELIRINLLPEEFSRRIFSPQVLNQGSVGSCVGQTVRNMFQDTEICNGIELSPMWIYKKGKEYDYWVGEDYSGTSISGALEGLRKVGACKEEFYPYKKSSENYDYLDGAEKDAAKRKIKAYYKISLKRTEEIKELLMNESLGISVKIHSDFYKINKNGVLKSSIEDYKKSPEQGGHAMTLIGWKLIDGKLYWELQNSWGVRWGDKGHCFISDEMLKEIKTSDVYYIVLKTENEETEFLKFSKKENKIIKFIKQKFFIILSFLKKLIGK